MSNRYLNVSTWVCRKAAEKRFPYFFLPPPRNHFLFDNRYLNVRKRAIGFKFTFFSFSLLLVYLAKKLFLFRTKERTTRATFKFKKSKGNNYFPAK
jgi:hypothetical protein